MRWLWSMVKGQRGISSTKDQEEGFRTKDKRKSRRVNHEPGRLLDFKREENKGAFKSYILTIRKLLDRLKREK